MIENLNLKKGFSLVELLVVISIIGIISSIVLASLTVTRSKGMDAVVKSNLANARSQAELFFYAAGDTFSGACGAAAVNGVKTIRESVTAAGAVTGYTAVAGDFLSTKVGNLTTVTCHAISAGWAAEAPLKTQNLFGSSSGADMWCVDSNGTSKLEDASSLPGGDVTCN